MMRKKVYIRRYRAGLKRGGYSRGVRRSILRTIRRKWRR